jgi:hypothetical protein
LIVILMRFNTVLPKAQPSEAAPGQARRRESQNLVA